jgi:putative pyoverdin transport system ATP-binding/permease protein
MKVIRCLLTASWRLVALAGLAGLVSGLVGAALIAVIHATLSRPETSTAVWAWSFAGLCLLMFVSRIVSEVVVVRLGQATIAALRLRLSRDILAAPLRHLEELGTHRLLATLTDDVAAIGVAFVQLPMLGINAAMVAGCLVASSIWAGCPGRCWSASSGSWGSASSGFTFSRERPCARFGWRARRTIVSSTISGRSSRVSRN